MFTLKYYHLYTNGNNNTNCLIKFIKLNKSIHRINSTTLLFLIPQYVLQTEYILYSQTESHPLFTKHLPLSFMHNFLYFCNRYFNNITIGYFFKVSSKKIHFFKKSKFLTKVASTKQLIKKHNNYLIKRGLHE